MSFKHFIDNCAYAYDKLRITRRLAATVTLFLVYDVTTKAWAYAESSHFDGLAVAAIIAAVTAPLSTLMGYTMKVHQMGHNNDSGGQNGNS